ncbi:MAG: ACR3 family arsenite efflux transporter [Kosmotoga sp.]|nr:MAG: ACR3 family arsenite efflux transporter [Kosmotoga sp.]
MNIEVIILAKRKLDIFSKYLSIWVAAAMIFGAFLGNVFPDFSETLGSWKLANVSIPVAVVLLFMMFPIMLKINIEEITNVRKNSKPLFMTLVVNWAIKPFTMAFVAWLFIKVFFAPMIGDGLGNEYVAGMILLGLAPCTAMVLVWTYLAKGNINYALVQVSVNDLIILLIFAPLGKLLIGVSTGFPVPFMTIFWSVVFYVAFPLVLAVITRRYVLKSKGEKYLKEKVIPRFDPFTKVGLLLTLVLVFMFQGRTILENPLHIVFISIPLIIQTYLIFFIGYIGAKALKINYPEAAPSTFIGASNFFELSIAVALILFGMNSGAALATVVGVLVEVPVMLSLVAIMRSRKSQFNFLEQ